MKSELAEKLKKDKEKIEEMKVVRKSSAELSDEDISRQSKSHIQEILREYYKQKYREVFKEKPGFLYAVKERSCIYSIFNVVGKSVEESKKYIDFAFSHWTEATDCYNIRGMPIPSCLCQSWVYSLFKGAMLHGFRKGVKDVDGIGNRASTDWENVKDGW